MYVHNHVPKLVGEEVAAAGGDADAGARRGSAAVVSWGCMDTSFAAVEEEEGEELASTPPGVTTR